MYLQYLFNDLVSECNSERVFEFKNKDGLTLKVVAPFLKADDLEIALSRGYLTVYGKTKVAGPEGEIPYNLDFVKYVGGEYTNESIDASLADGVLQIELKKRDVDKVKIKVK